MATLTKSVKRTRTVPLIIGGVVLLALVALQAVGPDAVGFEVSSGASDVLTLSLSVLIEALPFIVLGVLLSVLVQIWIPASWLDRVLPKRAWARRLALSALGMFLPVCECGNVPLARGLLLRGFTVPETLTFLIAAPIVNPVVIITTHAAFGFDDGILVVRILGGWLIANLVGWIYSRHPDPASLLTPSFRAQCEHQHIGHGSKWARSLQEFVRELRAVMPALILGALVAGVIQVLVPRELLMAIGADPVLSILSMMALALIVAICSNVDAYFALAFASTFTPGAIVAFLLVGPLIDVKMLALIRTTFTTKTVLSLVAIVLSTVFVIAVGVNLFV